MSALTEYICLVRILMYPECILAPVVEYMGLCCIMMYSVRILCEPLYSGQVLLSLRPWRPRRRRGWPALGSCPSPCCWRNMVKAVEPDLLICLPYWTYKQISSGLLLSILSQYRERSGERTALLPVEACQLNAIRTSCKPRTKKNSPDTKLKSGKLVKRANFR